jgi:PAS domain S-box-containing protein
MGVEYPEKLDGALLANDGGFRQIIDTNPVLACSLTAQLEVELITQPLLDYFGKTLDELKNWASIGVVHPDDLEAVIAQMRHSAVTGEPYNVEHRCRRYDGVYRWFQVHAVPLRNSQGQIERWYALLIGIEDKRQVEEALRASERSLNLAINTIPELAWSTGPDGSVDFLNQRWLDYTGFTTEQALGWNWANALHADDIGGLTEYWSAIMASGMAGEYEARLRRFDGIYRWFLFRVVPAKDESGNVIKWYGQNIDIEERKRAEDAVRANEQALRATIDTIPAPAFSTRPDGYVDFLNQRWLDYAGMAAEQAQGWGWGSALHPDDVNRLMQYWQSCLDSGTEAEIEARYRRFDGVYRWCLVRANPLRDESGNVVKWYGISIDIEDRKRADEELRAKERDLIRIINTIPTAAWSTRPDGYCDFLSDRWLDYAGFTYEEAVGWRWAVAIHPDDAAGLQEVWLKALASGTPANAEARMRRFDGVYRWFLFLAKPFRDESGTIVKWYGTNVDIEDRKQADEALRASERTLNLIINTIPMLAWSTDPTGSVEFLNRRWLEFTGLSEEQASGFGWSGAIHPDDQKGLLNYWQAALASGTDVDVEARMRRFDGQYRWFLFRASPLRDEFGTIVKWYGTNIDIEDRKRADEELRRSEALLAEGQRLSRTGTFAWRIRTNNITWSEEFYRIFDITSDVPASLELMRLRVHPDDLPIFDEVIAQGLKNGTDFEHEHRLSMPDNSVRYLHVTAHAMRDREGHLEYIGAAQDVTQRRLAEQALMKARSELANVGRLTSLGELTAAIAHEVNQPLSGIATNTDTCLGMLSDDPPDIEGARETIRRIIRDSNRASDVIARLRALFSKKEINAEPMDLNEATHEVISLSLNELQRNRIVLRSEFGDLPNVEGDRIQLQQVILNLLRNASEALSMIDDRPRHLLVRTELDGEYVRFMMRDSGVGFSPEASDRLFDSFYSTKEKGMGIGLSVCRSIVEAHQGRIWAVPNEGPGSTFAFSLPIKSLEVSIDPDSR